MGIIGDSQTLGLGLNFKEVFSTIISNELKKKKIAEEIKSNLNNKYNGKIVTNISKQKNYCKAEEYHQKYMQKEGF